MKGLLRRLLLRQGRCLQSLLGYAVKKPRFSNYWYDRLAVFSNIHDPRRTSTLKLPGEFAGNQENRAGQTGEFPLPKMTT